MEIIDSCTNIGKYPKKDQITHTELEMAERVTKQTEGCSGLSLLAEIGIQCDGGLLCPDSMQLCVSAVL